MVSNKCKEYCREIGLLAEHIVCMADGYEEPVEKFRKSLLYSHEFEDKEKMIWNMRETGYRISETVKEIDICDLEILQNELGVSVIEYCDLLNIALRTEPYSNNEVKYKCDAILSIAVDMLHRVMRKDEIYKKIAKGEVNENVQIQFLSYP